MDRRKFLATFKREVRKHKPGVELLSPAERLRVHTPTSDDGPRYCCPITFVTLVVCGASFPSAWYLAAAERLGLPEPLANEIADAADNRFPHGLPEKKRAAREKLRNDLLAAVGLA